MSGTGGVSRLGWCGKPYAPQSASRFEVDGDQAVTVDGYGYRWSGTGTLEVGDRVLLPENYVSAQRHGPAPFPQP